MLLFEYVSDKEEHTLKTLFLFKFKVIEDTYRRYNLKTITFWTAMIRFFKRNPKNTIKQETKTARNLQPSNFERAHDVFVG